MGPLALAFAGVVAAAGGVPLVISPAPDAVAVTVYRDPDRDADGAMDTKWLEGFALISERRTIRVPAGRSELRFEGVAGGILPQSAIVTGLPGGTIEKNRDARLLSAGALIDAHLGRRVLVTRTNPATGKVSEAEAVVRAGPDGVVFETKDGVEALGCSGLPEAVSFAEVPAGLSAKPTLAVTTDSPAAVDATVTLSYIATDFDWQADYVAVLSEDGRTLDLSSWLTLANGNRESLADAELQAVAGKLERTDEERAPASAPRLELSCWPVGGGWGRPIAPPPPPPPAPAPPMGGLMMEAQDVVVTGMRRRVAEQEELGDLKLYRVPDRVTVAAAGTKQIGLLDKPQVRVAIVNTAEIAVNDDRDAMPLTRVIRLHNTKAEGLGLPLPLGRITVFARAGGRQLLVGEGSIRDAAVGEEVETRLGENPALRLSTNGDARHRRVEIANSAPYPVVAEVVLWGSAVDHARGPGMPLARKNGQPLWRVTVPANGRAALSFAYRDPD